MKDTNKILIVLHDKGVKRVNKIRPSGNYILLVENLVVDFPGNPIGVRVLNGISLCLKRSEILGLVGESGSGKSVLARSLIRLEPPAKIISGSILLDGQDLTKKNRGDMRRIRGKKISLAMQNPQSAMDPVFTMGNQFREIFSVYDASKHEKHQQKFDIFSKISERLQSVGIATPRERCRQYPHEWSRGMLQRAQLVMASAYSPEVLILDEVTSALDPTISLQILDVIVHLKEEHGAGIILITHDLSVALTVCDRIAVMHKGYIVETGFVRQIIDNPVHTYTRLLVSSI